MVLATRILAAALFVATPAFAQDEVVRADAWMQDFAAAQEKAKAENKDLLIDFTGSDWCVWCQRLDKEVFQAGDFEVKIQEQFVLVKLDFPNDKKLVTEEVQKQNKALMGRFGVQGFPTVFFADASGTPYAKTGYQPGGPENYLTHVAEKKQAKTKFADAIGALGDVAGTDRAKKLDEALATLDAEILLPFYLRYVDEIITLDAAGEAGLKSKYDAMKNEYAERAAMMELNEAVGPFFESEDWPSALKAVDEFVAKYKTSNPSIAQQAMMAKVGVFMQQKKFDDAVKAIEDAKALAPESELGKQADMIIQQIKMMASQPADEEGEGHSEDDGHDHGGTGGGGTDGSGGTGGGGR